MILPKMKLHPAVIFCRLQNVLCTAWPVLFLSLGLLIYCSGCSSISTKISRGAEEAPETGASVEAQTLLAELNRQNASLNSFKGLGKIELWQNGRRKFDERVAWIGAERNKLSIVLMISGYPAVRMTSDGEWFYYYEVGEGKPIYRKIPASEASLKHIISIPIQAGDVVELLAGRVPLREHDRVTLQKQETEPGYVLTLKKQWWGVVEKIYLDDHKARVNSIEYYSRMGSLVYRVRFEKMQSINGYQVPALLSVSNGVDSDFQLVVDRYYTDVPVTASMFVLDPPD
jgi:hypothetical protein